MIHIQFGRNQSNRVSKIVAQNQFTIDLITTSLLSSPSGTYTIGGNMFIDGTECDILYIPHSADLANLPPVIVEIQHTVTREFMCRAVQYCLNVYKRFHVLPILFIVCISKTESKALRDLFKPIQNRSYLLETPCCHFATSCFMLTKQSIDPFIDNYDMEALDPLVAFAHFLTSGQQSIISIDRWDDPTVTKLYLVAMEMVKNDRKSENDKVEALQTICQATQNQFEKIMTTIFDNPSQAHRYADAGRHYSASLKRKYDTMKQRLSNSPSEATTPMELPKDFDGASNSTNFKYKELAAFIDAWKQNKKGRMNWSACWEEGKKKGLFNEYSNGHSLKNIYHKIKKISNHY
ncbi:hypothetical protein G6F57_012291 [Rhizopus arrhizus]|uniref:Uncharacterized protein n=1 Tax=Rhizopus oryzae TaxID=64495 RepID=A0A9P6WYT8_RHIOR|nr:hypothetical protein G6F30_011934 [Rhizopus arrhizus]KAG1401380.1 hypothetical protein G6F58_010752 [Rhizopus delemar]KAG0975655.1 hypothetical protein G6F29_011376 [Rhizopus arrhizus]KAG0979347.1 hypothetical protein G6F28_011909 [Rhizopus arrhizus]KAG1003048.1 hypothetical protein G6F27_011403 [Rhizopus arrhizus]